jgi:hypothetical protein
MSTSQDFTDANGHVYLDGQPAPQLQAVGFMHRHPCPLDKGSLVQLGEPFGCECGGTVLIGWRHWWPLPDKPQSPGILIDTYRELPGHRLVRDAPWCGETCLCGDVFPSVEAYDDHLDQVERGEWSQGDG